MSEVEKLRLFVAIDVPPQHLGAIADATGDLRARWPGARWAPVENQHVTLKFLGSTPSDRLGPVASALATVARAHRPAKLRLSHLGAFPSRTRVRVLWVGLDDEDDALARVARDLDQALEPLGFVTEQRPFAAHLTLARFKVPERTTLPDLSFEQLGRFEITRFHLFRSRLHPSGARYEILQSFELGGSDG